MSIEMNTGRRRHTGRELDLPTDAYELEERLAQLERRYAEANMRLRRARDELHVLRLQPEAALHAPLAAAQRRHDLARAQCDELRRDIERLESLLA